MRRSRATWWLAYAACALLALAALGWVTETVLDLERKEQRARSDAAFQESLRLALWRMDSWFGPHLAREAARPLHEYLSYYAQERAYTRILNEIEPGEVLSPSPLLAAKPELFRLHFQVDRGGAWSSPQVPEGNWLDLAEATLVDPERIRAARAALDELAALCCRADLAAAIGRGEAELAALLDEPAPLEAPAPIQGQADSAVQSLKNQAEFSQRAKSSKGNYGAEEGQWNAPQAEAGEAAAGAATIQVGPLVPIWLARPAPGAGPELCYARRLRGGDEELLQGFLVDWPRLNAELLERVADLFPGASLAPISGAASDAAAEGSLLATIPALLEAPPPPLPALHLGSPARATLALSWIAALLALAAAGVTLSASISFGERRSRFASTVTHELRTPLTTFRMYSEMLAKGMVPEERRHEYLATLERESNRLAILVENVLAYARLEDGRAPLRRERIGVGELVERVRPVLDRRAHEAGAQLEVELDGAAAIELETDPDAVHQILFNLVDNACKYGRSEAGLSIELAARASGASVELRVRDRGAGVPARAARSIFHPFERGGRDASDPVSGVGLGLALSRALARDLGGELTLEPANGAGASFRLTLRRA